jgi:hypothetical protein
MTSDAAASIERLMNDGKRTNARFKARNVARRILGPGLWLSLCYFLGRLLPAKRAELAVVDSVAWGSWRSFHGVGNAHTYGVSIKGLFE